MDEHTFDFTLPDGKVVKAMDIPIVESKEQFSEFTLSDGTILRIKTTILGASRNLGRYGTDGSPEYNLKLNPLINFVVIPDKLKDPNRR